MFRTQKLFKKSVALLTVCWMGATMVPCEALPAAHNPAKAAAGRPAQEAIPDLAAYGIPYTVQFHSLRCNGTRLTYIKPGAILATKVGLRPQDVVYRINNTITSSPTLLNSALRVYKTTPKRVDYFRNTGTSYEAKQANVDDVVFVRQFKDASGKPIKRTPQAELEDYLITLVNEDRSKNGLSSPLRKSSGLSRMARSYADDMAKRNFHGHKDPEGRDPWARAKLAGITSINIRENCVYPVGQPNSLAMVRAGEAQLMDSPEHKSSIVQKDNKCVGCGIAYRLDSGLMIVQVFSPDDIP